MIGETVRLDFSTVADAVGRLNDAGLVAGGGVAMMNLAPVRLALADRWPGKRDQVWEHAERTLVRMLGPATVVVRTGEDDLLVAQPGVERLAALGQALQALREILTFFLGAARPGDLRLRQVDSISGSEVRCSDLPPMVMTGQAHVEAVSAPPSQRAPAKSPPWRVFAAHDGATLRVSCALDRLITLKTGAITGCRLRPAVVDVSGPAPTPVRLSTMEWRDAERVDMALLDQASEVIAGAGEAPLVVAPASFSTLSSQRGRRLVSEQLETLAARFQRRVALEIRDLRGVPAGRLAEVVGQLKPSCHGVLGEIEPDRAEIAALAGCGFSGLSIRPRRDWTRDPRQIEQFASLADLARRITPIALTRAFCPDGLAALAKAGFTHATIGADQISATAAAA